MGYSMVDIYYPKDFLTPGPSWPDWLKREFLEADDNGHVGMELLSETGQVRVWFILLKPCDRLPAHKPVLNYVWIVTHPGKGRSHYHNGEEHEKVYTLGQAVHHSYETGQFMMHDLENIVDCPMFCTSEELV